MARWAIPLPDHVSLDRVVLVGSALVVVGIASGLVGLVAGGAPIDRVWVLIPAAAPFLTLVLGRLVFRWVEPRVAVALTPSEPHRAQRASLDPGPPSAPPIADRLGVLRDHPARRRSAWAESWSAHGVRLELRRAGGPSAWVPGYQHVVVEISAHHLLVDASRFDVVDVRHAAFDGGAIVVERRDGTTWRSPALVAPDPVRLDELLGALSRDAGEVDVDRVDMTSQLAPLVAKLRSRG